MCFYFVFLYTDMFFACVVVANGSPPSLLYLIGAQNSLPTFAQPIQSHLRLSAMEDTQAFCFLTLRLFNPWFSSLLHVGLPLTRGGKMFYVSDDQTSAATARGRSAKRERIRKSST